MRFACEMDELLVSVGWSPAPGTLSDLQISQKCHTSIRHTALSIMQVRRAMDLDGVDGIPGRPRMAMLASRLCTRS